MFKSFSPYKNLIYGLSQIKDGSMRLDETENRQKYFASQRFDQAQTTSAKQIHSAFVSTIQVKKAGQIILNADGLITNLPNQYLTVTVADCFPLYFYNPKTNQVALVHSGWRGTVKNIANETVLSLSGNPKDILVGIGSGIQKCHFEIQSDVLSEFSGYPQAIIYKANKIFIDLPTIIKFQLQNAGVENIESFDACTYCRQKTYFSHRRDKPIKAELMLAYIGMRTE